MTGKTLAGAILISASLVCIDTAFAAKRQGAPTNLEALHSYCRQAVFRKYGSRHDDGYIYMREHVALRLIEYCIRNGGKVE